MSSSIARHCPQCHQYSQAQIISYTTIHCPACKGGWGEVREVEKIFDCCPICQGRQFYVSKDFNQFIGCLIMLPGIILVPWTFGLSLPVFALIDWLLFRRIPSMICCYKCGSEFRGFPVVKDFKPFMHHIGLKYDKYRSMYK